MLLMRRVSVPAWAVIVALVFAVASWIATVVVVVEPRRWGDVAAGLTREPIRELLGIPEADMAEKGWDGWDQPAVLGAWVLKVSYDDGGRAVSVRRSFDWGFGYLGWDRTYPRDPSAPRAGAGPVVGAPTARAAEPSRAAPPASVEQDVLRARDPEDRGTCFEHALADLDGDGKDEVLVLDRGPAWCGTGGCTVTIYARGPQGLAKVASIPLVDRLDLEQGRTNGWRDLVVRNRYGTWLLAFDGKTYPDNPTVPPAKKILRPDPAAAKLAWTNATTCR